MLNVGYNNEQMLDAGVIKPLELLANRNWGDEDIVNDIKSLRENLEKNIVELSSFDMYKKEVLSGNLEWSPVHRSEKFWKENSYRFEEDNYKLLTYTTNEVTLTLQSLLKQYITTEVPNSLVTAVACYDIGEFARIHPRGRKYVVLLCHFNTLQHRSTIRH